MRSKLFLLFMGLCFLNFFLLGAYFHIKKVTQAVRAEQTIATNMGVYPELTQLPPISHDFVKLSAFFKTIAEQKGGGYAFDVLRHAPPFQNIDLHLLGHVIGDVLFKQQGIAGMSLCTNDFRNACSHTIVIGAFLQEGEAALPQIAQACKRAPGGEGAYFMCFHGLGHGVLAYTDYDFPKTIALCKKVGTPEYQNREYVECVGGAVMEMVFSTHDAKLWAQVKLRYFKPNDAASLCTFPFMTPEIRPICYIYMTPHFYEAAGATLGSVKPSDYPRAFQECAKIPPSRVDDRDGCYGGFGKEFVVMAMGRDVRQTTVLSQSGARDVVAWCQSAGSISGRQSCLDYALGSAFWSGENQSISAIRLCDARSGASDRTDCFLKLFGMAHHFLQNQKMYENFCTQIPVDMQGTCRS